MPIDNNASYKRYISTKLDKIRNTNQGELQHIFQTKRKQG